jgi:fused signal recognition particle receptor
MPPLSPLWAADPATFWQQNGTILIVAAVVALVALGLLVAAWLSSRSAIQPLPPEPPKKLERPPEIKAAPPPKPKAKEAPPPPGPELSPEERRRLKDEEEERKRAAYRARKDQETQEREAKRREEEERKAQVAEEAADLAADQARQKAAAEAELQKRVQAEAGKTLSEGLAKTRGGLMGRLNAIFGGEKQLDSKVLADLEEALLSADIGVKTSMQLLDMARDGLARKELSDADKIKSAMKVAIEKMVTLKNGHATTASQEEDGSAGRRAEAEGRSIPKVWMIVGVNGAGKTTTIGKLAAALAQQGKKVVLGAADTFRAAATEQLDVWAQRSGAQIVKGSEGSDPGAVAFETVKKARESGSDCALIDTAGRLHTKAPLMEELKKVKRVLEKAQAGAPHEVLLVLDSTNGQNAIAQARQFNEALGVTGIVLTKLDGTAKGGVVIGICDELKIPVRYVGVGEAVADLRPFDPHEYVEALFN